MEVIVSAGLVGVLGFVLGLLVRPSRPARSVPPAVASMLRGGHQQAGA